MAQMLETEINMKNAMIRTTILMIVLAASAVSAPRLQAASASLVPAAGTTYEWRFDSSANPALPEVSATAGAEAAITPGQFSDAWFAKAAILGAARGVWDLGKSGTITIKLPPGAFGPSGVVSVKVVQYYDHNGGLYNELATVSVPGALPGDIVAGVSTTTALGGWFSDETQWRAQAGAVIDTVVITGAPGGSLIDSVVVSSSLTIAQPPILSIVPVGGGSGQVLISWPAGYAGLVLESTADLSDPDGWTPVDAQVETIGDTSAVAMTATGGAQFYRLRQP
jgi:hypothetical protein